MSVTELKTDEPLAGYFASIFLGMLVAAAFAGYATTLLPAHFSETQILDWRHCIGAAIFMGIALSNPVGLLIKRNSLSTAAIRFLVGLAVGATLQAAVFAPVAGGQLSYLFVLFSAGLLFPIVMGLTRWNEKLVENGSSLHDVIGRFVLRILSWPDRYLFTMLMATLFMIFWTYVPDWKVMAIVLGAGMFALVTTILITTWIERRRAARDVKDYDTWLAIEDARETQAPTTSQIAKIETIYTLRAFLPGAVMFAGLTRLAVDLLLRLFPNASASFELPADALLTVALVAISGVGLVFAGMFVILAVAVLLTEIVSQILRWSDDDARDARYRLLRSLYFRPFSVPEGEEET